MRQIIAILATGIAKRRFILLVAAVLFITAVVVGCSLRSTGGRRPISSQQRQRQYAVGFGSTSHVLLCLAMGPELVLESAKSLHLTGLGSQLAAGRHQLIAVGQRLQVSGVSLPTPVDIQAPSPGHRLSIAGKAMPFAAVRLHVADGQVQVVQSLAIEDYLVGVLAKEVSA